MPEISAHLLIEAQTRKLARIWKSSNPKPRNRAMGFKHDEPVFRRSRKWYHYANG